MSFYGVDFIYKNKSLSSFDMFVISNDNNESNFIVSKHSILTEKVSNNNRHSIISVDEDEPLTFEITIASEKPLKRYEIDKLQKWLSTSDKEYNKLYILQEDFLNMYYLAKVVEITANTLYNFPYSLTIKFQCDSQYCWRDAQSLTYTITNNYRKFIFYNESSETHLKPTYVVKCNKADGTILIKNNTTNTSLELKNLLLNEVITINTNDEIFTSSSGILVLNRITNIEQVVVAQENNEFEIIGDCSQFQMNYQIGKKFGG